MKYEDYAKMLAPLEEFPREAFAPDVEVGEEVCGFFIALGVVYCDLKDLMLCNVLLETLPEVSKMGFTPQCGEYSGMRAHMIRNLIGVLHELLELARNHRSAVNSEVTARALAKCTTAAQTAWNAIISAAGDVPTDDDLSRIFMRVRNDIAFHYNPKQLCRGFIRAFSQTKYGKPVVSRGQNMGQSRFYFAEAASEESLVDLVGGSDSELLQHPPLLIKQVNHALYGMITGFVSARGYSFKKWRL